MSDEKGYVREAATDDLSFALIEEMQRYRAARLLARQMREYRKNPHGTGTSAELLPPDGNDLGLVAAYGVAVACNERFECARTLDAALVRMVANLAGVVFGAFFVPDGWMEEYREPAQIQRAVRLARQLVEEVERTGRGKMPQKIADPEPTCPGPNCVRCSGEYCDVHLTDPCDCGTVERHASDAVTRGLRDGGK